MMHVAMHATHDTRLLELPIGIAARARDRDDVTPQCRVSRPRVACLLSVASAPAVYRAMTLISAYPNAPACPFNWTTCGGNDFNSRFSNLFYRQDAHGRLVHWHDCCNPKRDFNLKCCVQQAVTHGSTWFPDPTYHASVDAFVAYVMRVAEFVPSQYLCDCGIRPVVPSSAQAEFVALHWRCSDVPFTRHRLYHLPHASYLGFVLRHLLARGAPRRLILLGTDHTDKLRPGYPNAAERRACDVLGNASIRLFESHGFAVSRHRGGAHDALAHMLGAHTLVTTMASSFSFFAGLAKRPLRDRFLTPLLYREVGEAPASQPHHRAATDRFGLGERFYVGSGSPGTSRAVLLHSDLAARVPWTMHDEGVGHVLHGMVANRSAYVALVHAMARELAGLAGG